MDPKAEAQALLNNEAFKAALESAQKAFINQAMGCDLKDDDGRRLNLSAARIVTTVANYLAALSANTEVEAPEIPNFYEERAKRRFAFFNQ